MTKADRRPKSPSVASTGVKKSATVRLTSGGQRKTAKDTKASKAGSSLKKAIKTQVPAKKTSKTASQQSTPTAGAVSTLVAAFKGARKSVSQDVVPRESIGERTVILTEVEVELPDDLNAILAEEIEAQIRRRAY